MLENPIITLTTDLGLKDPFIGLMKGVILGINPKARIIDITHSIHRHNVYEASQVLSMSYKYFPDTTIHIAVVDPGVGSNRRPILIATDKYYFIGPDNGVFTPVYEESASGFIRVIHISAQKYFLPMSGSTFHGRDIFSPVAAYLSKGIAYDKFGSVTDEYEIISIPKPLRSDENTITGEIITIDTFGNAISNIKREDISGLDPSGSLGSLKVIYRNMRLNMVNYYAENEDHDLTAIINSFGNLELFVFKDSAADKFNVKTGDKVSLTLSVQ